MDEYPLDEQLRNEQGLHAVLHYEAENWVVAAGKEVELQKSKDISYSEKKSVGTNNKTDGKDSFLV